MKALCYPAWDQLEVREVAEPTPKPGEVIVRVAAVGICGSEIHGFVTHAARRTPPLIMGHEFCRTVASAGPGVSGFRSGDRVAVNSVISCGRCEECLDGRSHLCREGEVYGTKRSGAFAEFCAAPASTLLPLPENVSFLQAALTEPLANAVHALSHTRLRFPETLVIFGAGTIGLFVLQVARRAGVFQVAMTDVSDSRLEVARQLGADITFNPRAGDIPAAIRKLTRGRGADVAVDAVGAAETRHAAVMATRPGGEIVWLGLHDDSTQVSGFAVVLEERRISGSFAVTPRDLRTAINLFATGKIELTPWVRTFPLSEGARVFQQLVTAPPRDYIKAILLP
ncbi:MAG TPA: galactitol-1-phosphate 5-dehydrogenase [Candidatus Acidoferrum sp.]|nr:galactitol-1-phosphate 5-dehydrogenase [Candidatus Acidoferrum sp.]